MTAFPVPLVCFSSGNGGTGVSSFASRFSSWLSDAGKKILFVDAGWGMGSSHFYFNIEPGQGFIDYVGGKAGLRPCLVPSAAGVTVLAGTPGSAGLSQLSPQKVRSVASDVASLAGEFDIVVADVPSGLRHADTIWHEAASLSAIIVTPDTLSIMCGYAILKNLSGKNGNSKMGVMVNRCTSPNEGRNAFQILREVANRFLGFSPFELGFIPFDLELLRKPSSRGSVSRSFEESFSHILSVLEILSQESAAHQVSP